MKTHFLYLIIFFFENHAVCEIMWINIVESDPQQITIWHMHIECWIPKATNTHSECVIIIVFPRQQYVVTRKRLSVTFHTHCRLRFGTYVYVSTFCWNRWYPSAKQHGVTFCKTVIFVLFNFVQLLITK